MHSKNGAYEIDMIHGGLAGKLLLFAVPLILSSLLQLLFNAADVIVVGRYAGKEALAAVGSTGSLINLMINIFMGLSVGANVVIAHDLGAGDTDKVKKGIHTSIALSLIGGGCLTVVGLLFSRQLLKLTSSPADVIDLAALYMRIYFCGMPANMVYNFGSAILRTEGDTRRPLYILTAAGVLNAGLNLFFVIVFQMSVAGVALATILSQYLSAALVVLCLVKNDDALHLDLRSIRLDGFTVRRILQVGLPAGFQGIVFSLSNVVIQSSINSFNDTAIVAGSAASANIEGFVYVAMNAFYQTCLTFSSQNFGAKAFRRVDRAIVLCQVYVTLTGLALGSLAVHFGRQLASIYAPGEEAVIEQAVIRMRYTCQFYFLCGIMDTFVGAQRGLGYSVAPMVISMLGACASRLIWLATVFQAHHTTDMIYITYPLSWLLTLSVHFTVLLIVRKRAYARKAAEGERLTAPAHG